MIPCQMRIHEVFGGSVPGESNALVFCYENMTYQLRDVQERNMIAIYLKIIVLLAIQQF